MKTMGDKFAANHDNSTSKMMNKTGTTAAQTSNRQPAKEGGTIQQSQAGHEPQKITNDRNFPRVHQGTGTLVEGEGGEIEDHDLHHNQSMKRFKISNKHQRAGGSSGHQGLGHSGRIKRSNQFGSLGAGIIHGGQAPQFMGIYTNTVLFSKRSQSRGVAKKRRGRKIT